MTTRMYFHIPDEETARAVVDDLRKLGIEDDALHAVAHRKHYPLPGIPEAGVTERTDLLNAARKGAGFGAGTGLIAGLAAVALPPQGLLLASSALVGALTAAGTAIGTWSSTLVGVGATHEDIQVFDDALERGEIVLLVDVRDNGQLESIEAAVRARHTDVILHSGPVADADAHVDQAAANGSNG